MLIPFIIKFSVVVVLAVVFYEAAICVIVMIFVHLVIGFCGYSRGSVGKVFFTSK